MSTPDDTKITSREVTLAGKTVMIERPVGAKASRALAIIRALSKKSPAIRSTLAEYTRTYERENVTELDRAQARFQFPPQVLTDGVGEAVREPATIPNPRAGQTPANATADEVERGIVEPEPDTIPNPRAGELVWLPSVIDYITDDDWARSDNRLKLPRSPSGPEVALAVMDVALEEGENLVYSLLALFVMTNEEVAHAWRTEGLAPAIDAKVDDLLTQAYFDELLELAVAVLEVIDGNLRRRLDDIGDRAGNALRRFGLSLPEGMRPTPATPESTTSPTTSTDGPSSSTPSSSTDAASDTDGAPETPSAPPSTSSSSSPSSPTETPETERSSS